MQDILDYIATQDPEADGALRAPSVYLSQKDPQDFIARLKTQTQVHDNPEDALNGQKFCIVEMTVTEINGPSFGSVKAGATYTSVPLRVGDVVSSIVEMATVGLKRGQINANFRKLANIASVLSGKQESAFYADGDPGPAGIGEYLNNDEGKHVHVFASEANKAGWTNPTFLSLG